MPACALPVLMYHYVSRFTGPINVTPEHFEQQCRGMAEHGWKGVSLAEAEAWLRGEAELPAKSVLISFDDGFLDNYVYAWPILREYGHHGVVFAVSERIGSGQDACVRPSWADVRSGVVPSAALPPVDSPLDEHALGYSRRNDLFMHWGEARALEADGTLAIAAHTARHHLVFASGTVPPRAQDDPNNAVAAARRFHTPGRRGNTFYRLAGDIPWGMPRFPERPAMSGPAFIPSPALVEAVRKLVPQDTHAAHAFFASPDSVRRLHALIDGFATASEFGGLGDTMLGTLEDEAMTRARMRAELEACAQTLKHELGHDVRSLCWPWGKGSDLARTLAQEQGFDVFFETRPGPALPGSHCSVPRFKVRDKGWPWLRLRLEMYARPLLGSLYARLKSS